MGDVQRGFCSLCLREVTLRPGDSAATADAAEVGLCRGTARDPVKCGWLGQSKREEADRSGRTRWEEGPDGALVLIPGRDRLRPPRPLTPPVHPLREGWRTAEPRSCQQVRRAAVRAGWKVLGVRRYAGRQLAGNGRQGRLYRFVALVLQRRVVGLVGRVGADGAAEAAGQPMERAFVVWRSPLLYKGLDRWAYSTGLVWCVRGVNQPSGPTDWAYGFHKVIRKELMNVIQQTDYRAARASSGRDDGAAERAPLRGGGRRP